MTRYFNTEGRCKPNEHYMVRLDDRLALIKKQFVDRGKYFVINRGRQYGKTTTLMALAEYLKHEYIVIPMDFQKMSTANFADEQTFVVKMAGQMEKLFCRKKELMRDIDADAFHELTLLKDKEGVSIDELFYSFSRICEASERPIVLMIDEVDSVSNNQVFIDFLAQLRGYYLDRDDSPIFHSVILAGVYDIKNLKLKIRPDSEHQYNSPWNIAADFDIDMSFSTGQISDMHAEYEADYHTGMDIAAVAEEIYQYTSGYPYLVSAICKIIDEKLSCHEPSEKGGCTWTADKIAEAVRLMMKLKTPLFDNLTKQLDTYKDLRKMIEEIIYQGKRVLFCVAEKSTNLGLMFGFLKEENGRVAVSNRIFEMYLLNLFIAEESLNSAAFSQGERDRNQFVSVK